MELYRTITEVIDMRSFSNLWFWIVLAVLWSSLSHFVLGIPYDMVMRARRQAGEADDDLFQMSQLMTKRITYITGVAGLWIITFASFLLAMLSTLAIWFRIEFAQALLCLYAPMLIVAALSVRMARIIHTEKPMGEALQKRLFWHRISIQVVGMIAIFITSMIGMWVNLKVGPVLS